MSYDNPRIDLSDTSMSMLMKMSVGNSGALTVLMETMKKGASIDPDCAFGDIGAILALDTHDIYGSDIWILYKDVCGSNLVSMLGLLRAVQLGFATEFELKHAITRYQIAPDRLAELLAKVKERLPKFGAESVADVEQAA